jgi:hypothetical protein
MAILFNCHCGRRLRAPDELAGRKIRCPECKHVLAIPAPAAVEETITAAPPSPAPAHEPEMVRFTCDCGEEMLAEREHAGKRTQCPACGAVLVIPAESGPEVLMSVASESEPETWPVRSPREHVTEEEPFAAAYDAEEDMPRLHAPARRKKRRVWPWVAALVVLLLLAGGGAAWFFLFRTKAVTDLDLVPRNAVAVVSVRVADVWDSELGKQARRQLGQFVPVAQMEQQFGMTPADIERVTVVFPSADPEAAWAVVTASKPIDQAKIKQQVLRGGRELDVKGKSYTASPTLAIYYASPQVAVAGSPAGIRQFLQRDLPGPGTGPMSEALKLIEEKKHQVVVAVNPPAEQMQKLKSAPPPPNAPPEYALARPFFDLQSVLVTADLGTDSEVDVRVRFPDDATAKKAQEAGKALLARARQALAGFRKNVPPGPQAAMVGQLFNQLDQFLQSVPVEQQGQVVRVPLKFKGDLGSAAILTGLMVPAVQKVRQATNRTQGSNNLKQLVLGMLQFAQKHQGNFPPAVFHRGLSWRVAILPYIGEEALYKEFDLHQPWNHPNNVKLLSRMPKVFAHPTAPGGDGSSTYYQVFAGPGAPFNGSQTMALQGFTDGTSNTFLIVEAVRPVPWTKPEDIRFDPKQPPQLGLFFAGGFLAALADASVEWFDPAKLKPETLRAAITPAGGEPMGPDWVAARQR